MRWRSSIAIVTGLNTRWKTSKFRMENSWLATANRYRRRIHFFQLRNPFERARRKTAWFAVGTSDNREDQLKARRGIKVAHEKIRRGAVPECAGFQPGIGQPGIEGGSGAARGRHFESRGVSV